jgi:hypothetical protein
MECGGLDTALDGAARRAASIPERSRRAGTCKSSVKPPHSRSSRKPPAAPAAGYVIRASAGAAWQRETEPNGARFDSGLRNVIGKLIQG